MPAVSTQYLQCWFLQLMGMHHFLFNSGPKFLSCMTKTRAREMKSLAKGYKVRQHEKKWVGKGNNSKCSKTVE